jgi:predicted Ser/Thr protein kinase
MAVAKEKKPTIDLEALNAGFQVKEFKKGDWVKVYKTPYKATRLEFEAEILSIAWVGKFGVMAEVLPQGQEYSRYAFLYGGRIHNPYK